LGAVLKRRPFFRERLLAWRRVQVQLEFGAPTPVTVADVVSCLAAVLWSDDGFCEYLPSSPTEILRRFEYARFPSDIIRIARDYDDPAV
jgi:hypothetical protein